jgi:hypothetical protein
MTAAACTHLPHICLDDILLQFDTLFQERMYTAERSKTPRDAKHNSLPKVTPASRNPFRQNIKLLLFPEA